MRLEQHVFNAIDDYQNGKIDSALMHACFAIDGTAKKRSKAPKSGKQDYKDCLRSYWWLIERFIGDGLNLEETRWSHIVLDNGHGKLIRDPDLADIIYHIFRCSHAHAEEVPLKFELLPVQDGYGRWFVDIVNGGVQMPERVIWALLAVSIFAECNSDIKTDTEHFLSWGSQALSIGPEVFMIRDFWGREGDVKTLLSQYQQIRVKIVF